MKSLSFRQLSAAIATHRTASRLLGSFANNVRFNVEGHTFFATPAESTFVKAYLRREGGQIESDRCALAYSPDDIECVDLAGGRRHVPAFAVEGRHTRTAVEVVSSLVDLARVERTVVDAAMARRRAVDVWLVLRDGTFVERRLHCHLGFVLVDTDPDDLVDYA